MFCFAILFFYLSLRIHLFTFSPVRFFFIVIIIFKLLLLLEIHHNFIDVISTVSLDFFVVLGGIGLLWNPVESTRISTKLIREWCDVVNCWRIFARFCRWFLVAFRFDQFPGGFFLKSASMPSQFSVEFWSVQGQFYSSFFYRFSVQFWPIFAQCFVNICSISAQFLIHL